MSPVNQKANPLEETDPLTEFLRRYDRTHATELRTLLLDPARHGPLYPDDGGKAFLGCFKLSAWSSRALATSASECPRRCGQALMCMFLTSRFMTSHH